MHALSEWVGRRLSVYLTRSSHHHSTSIPPISSRRYAQGMYCWLRVKRA